MPWCPTCKLEYVSGVKICPDCKTALVSSLQDVEEASDDFQEEFEDAMYKMADGSETPEEYLEKNPVVLEMIETLRSKGLSDEEIKELLASVKQRATNNAEEYHLISDKFAEHKSGAGVLIVCGIIGLVVLILNLVGVVNLPVRGFTKYLTTAVMGFLFLLFFLSGIKSAKMVKKLGPQVKEEEEKIKEVLDFLKKQKAEGAFDLNTDELSMEEASLVLSNVAVQMCEKEFDDLAPGFAYYVTDRYYSEIFENED